jgi:hypothetical protein
VLTEGKSDEIVARFEHFAQKSLNALHGIQGFKD